MKKSFIEYFTFGICITLLIHWAAQYLIHIIAICYSKYRLHRKPKNCTQQFIYPTVSVIKPLMGEDENLHSNLEPYFKLEYPSKYELLFCAEDPTDPSLIVVRELKEKYSSVQTEIYIGGSNVGVNPKINNMNKAYENAQYEMVVISDSGIKIKPDALMDMVEHMSKDVAYVHQMPYTCDREGFAGRLEQIFFGTFHARMYMAADLLGINCASGMSGMIRKDVLDSVGGLKHFGCYLAEDYFIAQAILDKGWKLNVCSQPCLQNSANCNVSLFQGRVMRWAKLRFAMVPLLTVIEPLSNCLVTGTVASVCGTYIFQWNALMFLLIHILVWMVLDWVLLTIVQNGKVPFNKIDYLLGWLYREVSGPCLLIFALFNSTIKWRTRVFKLAWGGMAYEITQPTKPV